MDLSPDVNFKQVSHNSVVRWLENKVKTMAMAKLSIQHSACPNQKCRNSDRNLEIHSDVTLDY